MIQPATEDAVVIGAMVVSALINPDFDGDERHGLIAVTQRGGRTYRVSLLDIEFTPRTTPAALAAGYRHWLGWSDHR